LRSLFRKMPTFTASSWTGPRRPSGPMIAD
jgi:hypothetical protein